jgi:hypothetical protein
MDDWTVESLLGSLLTGLSKFWSMPSVELALMPGASSLWLATSVSASLADALELNLFVEEVQAVSVNSNEASTWAVGEYDASGDPVPHCSCCDGVALCYVGDGQKL